MKTSEYVIYENSPARGVTEAFPLGNGKLGALLFGECTDTKIIFTHQDVSDGVDTEEDFDIPFDGEYIEISEIKEYLSRYKKRNIKNIGELGIKISGASSEYKRFLDLRRSVAEWEFSVEDNKVKTECFLSSPANLLILEMKSEKRIDAEISLDMFSAREIYAYGMQVTYLSDANEENYGKSYAAAVRINTDGAVTRDGKVAHVTGATLIRVVVTAEPGEDVKSCEAAVLKRINSAILKGYNTLKEEHIADVSRIFDRVELTLLSPDFFDLSTSKRLKAFPYGAKDYALPVLLFNMGRYLYTASYRENSRCENLYGLWNIYDTPFEIDPPEINPSEWTPDLAMEYIRSVMTIVTEGTGYGIFPNMMFALEKYGCVGNLAFSAALYEMLINEKRGRPTALPSLPAEFATGSVKGIKIESGRMADVSWCDGRVVEFKVYLSDNTKS